MLYTLYETQRSLMEPFADLAQAAAKFYSNPLWPFSETQLAHRISAGYELLYRLGKDYEKPEFGISTVDGRDYYELFGEISSKTSLQTVLIELRMLASNAIDAAGDLRESFENLGGAAA